MTLPLAFSLPKRSLTIRKLLNIGSHLFVNIQAIPFATIFILQLSKKLERNKKYFILLDDRLGVPNVFCVKTTAKGGRISTEQCSSGACFVAKKTGILIK